MTVRVMVVDDHTLFRRGLCSLLAEEEPVEVVGQASDGLECLRLLPRARPDVILMDLRMPNLDGVETIRKLQEISTEARVVVLTTFDDDELVFEALRLGATSFLLKDATARDIVVAVQDAAAGRSRLAPQVAGKVVSEFARMAERLGQSSGQDHGLSNRELDVLRLLAKGSTNRQIATALGLASGTVKNHVTHILDKLDVSDRTTAALKARELGLV